MFNTVEQNTDLTPAQNERRRWMSVLAEADFADLIHYWEPFSYKPQFSWIRRPETGAILLRCQIPDMGLPFNFSEITVTRCAIMLPDDRTGVSYVAGRSHRHVTISAVLDALLQKDDGAGDCARKLITCLQARQEAMRSTLASKIRATRVDFSVKAQGE